VLLEPVMRVEWWCPRVHGRHHGRPQQPRGRITAMEAAAHPDRARRCPCPRCSGSDGPAVAHAGRATFTMHFDRYEQAPQQVSDEVVARSRALTGSRQSSTRDAKRTTETAMEGEIRSVEAARERGDDWHIDHGKTTLRRR